MYLPSTTSRYFAFFHPLHPFIIASQVWVIHEERIRLRGKYGRFCIANIGEFGNNAPEYRVIVQIWCFLSYGRIVVAQRNIEIHVVYKNHSSEHKITLKKFLGAAKPQPP